MPPQPSEAPAWSVHDPTGGAPNEPPNPTDTRLGSRTSRHLKRTVGFLVAGGCMPVLCGLGKEVLMRLLGLTWVGMDGYVPWMIGGFFGAWVGLGCVVASGLALIAAIRGWRTKRRLLG